MSTRLEKAFLCVVHSEASVVDTRAAPQRWWTEGRLLIDEVVYIPEGVDVCEQPYPVRPSAMSVTEETPLNPPRISLTFRRAVHLKQGEAVFVMNSQLPQVDAWDIARFYLVDPDKFPIADEQASQGLMGT